jgi:hypothetical protein
VERIRLDEHTLQIQLPKQLLENSSLVVFTCGIANLGDRHSQGCGVQRHLGDKCRTTAAGGLHGAPKDLAITDQLIEIAYPDMTPFIGPGAMRLGGYAAAG